MTYYSNSNQIRELVMQIVEEKVKPLNALETLQCTFLTISLNR